MTQESGYRTLCNIFAPQPFKPWQAEQKPAVEQNRVESLDGLLDRLEAAQKPAQQAAAAAPRGDSFPLASFFHFLLSISELCLNHELD